MPSLHFTRLDWDTNPTYPWYGDLDGISAFQIIPAGPQQWVVLAQLFRNTTGPVIVWQRVNGDWTSGAPNSNLSLGELHYVNQSTFPAALVTTSLIYAYDGYPVSGAGTTVGHLVVFNGLAGTVMYASIDYDSSTVTALHTSVPNWSAINDPVGFPAISQSVYAGNSQTVWMVAPNQSLGYIYMGAVNPQTGVVSSAYTQLDVITGTYRQPFVWDVDLQTFMVRAVFATGPGTYVTSVFDQSVFPPVQWNQTAPFPTWPNSSAPTDPSFCNVGRDSTNCGLISYRFDTTNLRGFLRTVTGGNIQLTEGASTLSIANPMVIPFNANDGQQMPAAGWSGSSYGSELAWDSYPTPSHLQTYTIGNTGDGSPVTVNTNNYPTYPVYLPGGATNVWEVGGLRLAAGGPAQYLNSYGGQYDTNGGAGNAPALWAFDTQYGTRSYNPLNLWAGAVNP